MQVSTIAPDPDDLPSPSAFRTLTPLDRTAMQLSLLNATIMSLARFSGDSKSPTDGVDIDPDVKRAASSSLTMLMGQIDNIVNDQPRWLTDPSPIEVQVAEMMKAETARTKADTKLREELVRPFKMLNGRLYRGTDGQILAVSDNEAVFAYGPTAAQAIANFDEAFHTQRHLPRQSSPPPEAETVAPVKKPRKTK